MFVLLSSELCLQWATFAGIRHTGSPIQRFIRSLFACFPGSLAWDRYFLCSWTPSSHLSPVSLSLVGTNLGFNLECGYGPWIGPHSLIYQHIYHIQISSLVFLPRTQAHWTLEATCAKGAWEDEISKTSRSLHVYFGKQVLHLFIFFSLACLENPTGCWHVGMKGLGLYCIFWVLFSSFFLLLFS